MRLKRDDAARLHLDDAAHLVKLYGVAPALAVAVDDEDIAVLQIALAERQPQPRRVAYRAQGAVGDDDAQIGKIQDAPVGLGD